MPAAKTAPSLGEWKGGFLPMLLSLITDGDLTPNEEAVYFHTSFSLENLNLQSDMIDNHIIYRRKTSYLLFD